MATTSIWSIKSRLDHVIEYASNPEKTSKEEYEQYEYNGLGSVIEYTTNDKKTSRQLYVSGINCHSTTALREMKASKKMFMKEDGILAFHAYQSFAPGEVTAEMAHQIGIDLANKIWGDRFEVVVSTHTDRAHLHNHFVINSVSFVDGKKYYSNKDAYREIRNASDELCRRYKLSVIEEPKHHSLAYQEYMASKTEHTHSDYIKRFDVDWAIVNSKSLTDFYDHLRAMGYIVDETGKHPKFKKPEDARFKRFYKLSKDGRYSPENIALRIEEQEETKKASRYEPQQKVLRYHGDMKKSKKLTGFKALYVRYMFLLGIIPKDRPNNREINHHLANEIRYIQDITRQATFIAKNDINNVEELHTKRETMIQKHDLLVKERKRLYARKNRAKDKESKEVYDAQISSLSERIRSYAHDIKMCNDIEYRSRAMKEKLELIRQERMEKESIKSKHNKKNQQR